MTSSYGLRLAALVIVSMFGSFAAAATSSGESRDRASSTVDYQPRSGTAWIMSRDVSGGQDLSTAVDYQPRSSASSIMSPDVSGNQSSSTALGYQPRSGAACLMSRGRGSYQTQSPARVQAMEAGPGAESNSGPTPN